MDCFITLIYVTFYSDFKNVVYFFIKCLERCVIVAWSKNHSGALIFTSNVKVCTPGRYFVHWGTTDLKVTLVCSKTLCCS